MLRHAYIQNLFPVDTGHPHIYPGNILYVVTLIKTPCSLKKFPKKNICLKILKKYLDICENNLTFALQFRNTV